MMSGMKKQRQITQHKRFAIAHPNFCFAETSLCWKRYTTWGAPQFPPEEKSSLQFLKYQYGEEVVKILCNNILSPIQPRSSDRIRLLMNQCQNTRFWLIAHAIRDELVNRLFYPCPFQSLLL